MNLVAAVAIFVGAGFGACLRWCLGIWFDAAFPQIPLGTLAANVLGGLLMGLALGWFAQDQALPPALRLALTTGFIGGLTTFSAFSAESAALVLRGQYGWACLHAGAHMGASLLAVLGGLAGMRWLLGSGVAAPP